MDSSPEGSENSRKENIPVSASPPSIEDDDDLLNDDEDVGIQNPDDVQIPEEELLRIDDELEGILNPPLNPQPEGVPRIQNPLDGNEYLEAFEEERRILEEEMPEGRESEDRGRGDDDDERMDTEEPESPPADAIRARDSTSAESMDDDADDEDEEESSESEKDDDQNLANVSLTAPVPLTQIDKSIHIGTEHQAQISNEGTPEPIPREEEISDDERETLIWDCEQPVDKKRLVDYIGETSGKFSMPIDRKPIENHS
ncbi:hypothetical protein CRE_14262 [Caenorhabditis remanei]|uniref:ELM2 domain-containing protein n=1 Tax=Caenorhabditis remanei TaxID=31234 RepID=E3N7P6_CAERE|nr:hypothetical protein CRE_14262 [Caenorhabditis remanei]